MTVAKQARERDGRAKQQEKEARRIQRKAEKAVRVQPDDGEDPDLVGINRDRKLLCIDDCLLRRLP